MGIYEFHSFDEADRRPLLDFVDGADDATALEAARSQLSRQTSCTGVEVLEAGRLVGRVTP